MLAKKILLFICLIFNQNILSKGFSEGTLVKTPNGYLPIEQLKENDLIISYDFDKSTTVQNKIVKTIKQKSQNIIRLSIKGSFLEIDLNQKIYCPLKSDGFLNKNWIRAKDIKIGQLILNNFELAKIEKIYEINFNNYLYDLSIEKNHNFFVTKNDILVHNAVPIIVWIAGEGIQICWAGVALVGAFIGCHMLKNYKNGDFIFQPPNPNDRHHIFNDPTHNFNGKDPDDIITKIIKMLEEAFKKGKLKNNHLYEENTMLSPNEQLVASGKVVDGVTRLGTAYIVKILKP